MALAQVPPSLHFQTLVTPHFNLHYHDGYEAMAQDVARAGEEALGNIEGLLDWSVKERIEVVLVDSTDEANGSAQVTPYPLVNLYVTAPDDFSFLGEYDDWAFELIGHELTHIVHLDTAEGIPKLINRVFGRTYYPNQYQARWFIEGLAVEMETRLSQGGRVRSKLADMVFRAEALEHRQMRLDQAVNGPLRFPQATSWYLHGGRFLTWVAKRWGHDKLKALSHLYGKSLIPYAMDRAFAEVTGETYEKAWAEFSDELQQGYDQQLQEIAANGIREGERRTFHGQFTYGPRYSPCDSAAQKRSAPPPLEQNGKCLLYFTESQSLISQSRLLTEQASFDGKPVSRKVDAINTLASASAPGPDGHYFFTQVDVAGSYFVYQDLFRGTLDGPSERLSWKARFRDPEEAGGWLYMIQSVGPRSFLVRAPLERSWPNLNRLEVVWDEGGYTQMYTPHVSPDGQKIAVSVHHAPGQRDIAIFDLGSKSSTFITSDLALDGGPVFSPDGAYLYFQSARTKVFNIFAHRLSDGHTFQVTNVRTAALSPTVSADGREMTYVGYTTLGYDLFTLPLDPEAWRPAPPGIEPREDTLATRPRDTYPTLPYSPWRTLLPQAWMPTFFSDALGPVWGVSLSASDPLARHSWAADIGYGLTSHDLNYSLLYQNHQLYPVLELTHSRSITYAPTAALIDGQGVLVYDRVTDGGASLRIPWQDYRHRLSLSVGYTYEHHERLTRFNFAPDTLRPSVPRPGDFAALSVSGSFTTTRRTLGAVSDESGVALFASGLWRERAWGSSFRQSELSLVGESYTLLPYLQNHVLALRLSVSGGFNELSNRPLFSLGGLPVRDFLRDLINQTRVGGVGLRGFSPGTFAGNFVYLSTAEYRAPLWRIERGWSVFPVYLRTLSGAAFVDVGSAAEPSDIFRRTGIGLGGELRLQADYGFFYGATIRLGYARGLFVGSSRPSSDNLFVFWSGGF